MALGIVLSGRGDIDLKFPFQRTSVGGQSGKGNQADVSRRGTVCLAIKDDDVIERGTSKNVALFGPAELVKRFGIWRVRVFLRHLSSPQPEHPRNARRQSVFGRCEDVLAISMIS